MKTTRWEGKVQAQVQLLQQEGCLEQPNLLLGECLEQRPAPPVLLGRAPPTSHSLEPVALALLPQLHLLQHLEALVPKQVKLVDSSDQNQRPLERLQQPLLPLHLALGRQQPSQAACLASQPSLLEQLHRHLVPPSQLHLPLELRRQARALEVLVLLLPSQQPPLASLETSLLNPHLVLAHLRLQQHLGLVAALGRRLPQVKCKYCKLLQHIRTYITTV